MKKLTIDSSYSMTFSRETGQPVNTSTFFVKFRSNGNDWKKIKSYKTEPIGHTISSDGNTIAVSVDGQIDVFDYSGESITKLHKDSHSFEYPQFGNDQNLIYYLSKVDKEETVKVMKTYLIKDITNPIIKDLNINKFIISPDDNLIGYLKKGKDNMELYIKDVLRNKIVCLTKTSCSDSDFIFSPDSESIVFCRACENENVSLCKSNLKDM